MKTLTNDEYIKNAGDKIWENLIGSKLYFTGGVGAAMLRARRCEGCRLELNPLQIQHIRAAAADEVVRCEECRRILVRTGESGL